MSENFRFAPEALVIDAEGNKLGQMNIGQAKALAREQGLDLIEVARQENLSVVRIIDKGKWAYEQKRNARKSVQHIAPQKEMKFRMRIEPHDLNTKLSKVQKFLEKGSDVRLVVEMKGRERANPKSAELFIHEILSHYPGLKFEDIKRTNANISTTLHPIRKTSDAREEHSTGNNGKVDRQVG